MSVARAMGEAPVTVGQLKSFLADVSDDLIVQAYEGEDNCLTFEDPATGDQLGHCSFVGGRNVKPGEEARSRYRVWWDHKRYTVEDGQDVDASSPEKAAEAFGLDRYRAFQHVDPGSCFVRAPDGTTQRFSLSVQVDIIVKES